jgi:hypothetical protein
MNIDDRSDALRTAEQLTKLHQKAIADAHQKAKAFADAQPKPYEGINQRVTDSLLKRHQNAIADALLEAHLEGIDQARSLFHQGKAPDEISKELDSRRKFLVEQLESK